MVPVSIAVNNEVTHPIVPMDQLMADRPSLSSGQTTTVPTLPAGRLLAGVMTSGAAYETEVLAGQTAARAGGKRWVARRRAGCSK
jgi:hypothetical protein